MKCSSKHVRMWRETGTMHARVAGLRALFALRLSAGLLLAAMACRAGAQGGTAVQRQSVPTVAATPTAAPAPSLPRPAGTELDRVVAIVNDDLVLDSDVAEEREFVQLQPIGLSGVPRSFDREQAIERLIDRDLILQQAKEEPGLQVSDSDLDKEIATVRKDTPACKQDHCETEAGWDRYLATHGFTADEFRERWRQRMEVLAFIEERFRAGIRIAEADIKAYYEKTMLPEYARQGIAPPKLEAVSGRIQEVLLQQQVSALLGDWLKQLRAQGSVAVLHPGEPAP